MFILIFLFLFMAIVFWTLDDELAIVCVMISVTIMFAYWIDLMMEAVL